jgi:putative ABC transport system permease protein
VGRTLRAAWWRRDLNLGLCLAVAAATAATAAAPTFAASATSALVRERLASADPLDTDVSWAVGTDEPARDLDAAIDAAHRLTDDADGQFGPTAVSASALATWPGQTQQPPMVLAWREGQCDQIVVTGACPDQPGEVLLPTGSATAQGYAVGDSFVLRQPVRSQDGDPPSVAELTVVGTWSSRDLGDDSWYDPSRWSAGGQVPTLLDCEVSATSEPISPQTGPLLTDLETLRRLAEVTVHADAAMTVTSDVERVRTAADRADRWQAEPTPLPLAPGMCVAPVSESDIGGVVGPIEDERSRLQRQGVGAAAGAVLIGVLAVVLITTISAGRRRHEMALLRMRGVRGVRLVQEAVAEPLVLVAVGALVGVPLGWLVGAFAARTWLGGDVATSLPGSVWPLAGLVVGLAVVGLVVGLTRTLREPVHRALRPSRRQPASAVAVLGRVAVFVVAAVGVYQLRHDEAADPPWWALTLPVVIGLAGGIVAGWLIQLAARSLTSWSRGRRGSGLFLGSRRLVRNGELLTIVPFAMAAIVLVVVAGGAWGTGAQWRESIAVLRTGGPVAADSSQSATATLAATRQADPDGQWLMTAVTFPDESGRVYRRLFVDTPRWDRVVAPTLADSPADTPSEVSEDALAALGEPPDVPTPMQRGPRISAVIESDLEWDGPSEFAELQLVVIAADSTERVVSVPIRHEGVTSPTVSTPYCATGCTVDSLRIRVPDVYSSSVRGRLTIQTLRLGSIDLLGLDWRALPTLKYQIKVSRPPDGGLAVRSFGESMALVLPPRKESTVPVMVAGGLDLGDPEIALEPGTALGIDGIPRPVRVVGGVDSLPLIGDEGVMGDLTTFLVDNPSVPPLGEILVVMRADTPDSVLAALRSAGVDLGQTRSIATSRELLDQDPYAQGLRFFWLAAALVAVIAVCAVGTALVSQRRIRAQEGASLRVVGLRGRQLRSAVAFEVGAFGILLGGCGWLAGWLGTWVTLPALPLGRPGDFEPLPSVSTAWTMGLLPALAAAALVSAAALAILVPMTVRARPAELRTGGD